ncbi:hypothetical protein FQZ97_831230 [compost metagenome]
MAVQQDRRGGRLQREFEAAGLAFAGDELFEQQRLLRDGLRLVAEAHHQRFVAQREQARGLEPDDGNAGLRQRQQRIDQCPGANLGLVHHAAGQEGPAAAVVPAALLHRVQRIARGVQHARRRKDVLAFEGAVEGVDEQHGDLLAARCGSQHRGLIGKQAGRHRVLRAPEGVGAPLGQ